MTDALIDSSARISAGAVIGRDVSIGPYCVIGGDVVIGDGCKLAAQVHVQGRTTIGARTRIASFTSLGGPPQSTRYRGGPTTLVVGADCDIREHVTMNIGTEDGGGTTTVGERCLIMVGSHIAHDCRVGNDVTFANNAVLGGHVVVGDNAFLGGLVAVHQFVRIGEGAMIGGMSGIPADVIPFGTAVGFRATLRGVNIVGMKRRGCSRDDIKRVWRAYRMLFHGDGTFEQRLPSVEREFAGHPLVGKIIDFIRASDHRSLMIAERSGTAAEAADAANTGS
jgi:UDP-N-acetylglucosamine acyltransferase